MSCCLSAEIRSEREIQKHGQTAYRYDTITFFFFLLLRLFFLVDNSNFDTLHSTRLYFAMKNNKKSQQFRNRNVSVVLVRLYHLLSLKSARAENDEGDCCMVLTTVRSFFFFFFTGHKVGQIMK